MAVKPIPEGYHSVTPYLSIKGAARALDFYKQAFGATELLRMDGPNGTIAHAEIRIGDSPIMLSDEAPNMVCASPDTLQATSVGLMIYVPNVDAVFANALKAGGTEVRPVVDQFYGDRSGMVACPFGYRWFLAARKEEVSPAEMQKRWSKMLAGGKVE